MPEKVLQVLVVGGGIGGLCLAQGLRKAGIQVKVFERDRTVDARLDRYRLHINPAGTRALRACLPDAVWDRFLAAVGRPGGGFLFLDEQLHELLSIEDSLMYPASDDSAERAYPVERRALRDVLLTDLADVVQFGKRFERYELQPNGGVTAWFTDGSRADGDLLVGADGSASQVRAQLLPRAKPDDTGAVGFGAKLPLTAQTRAWLPPELLDGETMIMTGDPFFLFTSVFQTLGEPDGTSSYLLCCVRSAERCMSPGNCGHGRPVDATGHRRPGQRLAPNPAPADPCLRPDERRDVPVRDVAAARLAHRTGHPPRRRDPSHATHRRHRCEYHHARREPVDPPARRRCDGPV